MGRLAGAVGALQAPRDDGISVKILTGVNERVATHACASVGIDPASLLLGSDLDKIDDRALEQVAAIILLEWSVRVLHNGILEGPRRSEPSPNTC